MPKGCKGYHKKPTRRRSNHSFASANARRSVKRASTANKLVGWRPLSAALLHEVIAPESGAACTRFPQLASAP
eukprot:scaffold127957_cov29-Tisochrysis_lutea.AAC.5